MEAVNMTVGSEVDGYNFVLPDKSQFNRLNKLIDLCYDVEEPNLNLNMMERQIAK